MQRAGRGRRGSAALAVLLVTTLVCGCCAAPDPLEGVCKDVCNPLQPPPESTPQGLDIGSFLAKAAQGMLEAGFDMLTDGLGEGVAGALAKAGTGAILGLFDPSIAALQVNPYKSFQRSIDGDLIQLQSYLACKMDSIVGKAVDTIVDKMDSIEAQRYDANINGVLEWYKENACAWNCLNYSSVPPSQRNCLAGTNCVTSEESDMCSGVTSWDEYDPVYCKMSSGLEGECDTDGSCYTGVNWDTVVADIRNILNVVFLSNSEIANLQGKDSIKFDSVTDLASIIAYGKGLMIKMSLLQNLVMLGAADGSIGRLIAFTKAAVADLQMRYDLYTSDEALRRILFKFSTPTGITRSGKYDNISTLIANGANASDIVPAAVTFSIDIYGSPYFTGDKWQAVPDRYQEVANACLLGSQTSRVLWRQYNQGWRDKNIFDPPKYIYPQIDPDYRPSDVCISCTSLEVFYHQNYTLRSSCSDPSPNVANFTNCPTTSVPQCRNTADGVTCAQAWTLGGGCIDQMKQVQAQCQNIFFAKAKADFDAAVAALRQQVVTTLQPIQATIAALRNLTQGMPGVANDYYLNNYYPYTSNCTVRSDYCSGGQKPQIPGPSHTNLLGRRPRRNACLSVPFSNMCPGAACDPDRGCKQCTNPALPILLPDTNRWMWRCGPCSRVGCAAGLCNASGCTRCGPRRFMAPAFTSKAPRYNLAYRKSVRSYNVCIPCSSATQGFGPRCIACTRRGCTQCREGFVPGGPNGRCRRRPPARK